MSLFYFNWFKSCLSKEPPSATADHIENAYQRNYLTTDEYNSLLEIMNENNPPAE